MFYPKIISFFKYLLLYLYIVYRWPIILLQLWICFFYLIIPQYQNGSCPWIIDQFRKSEYISRIWWISWEILSLSVFNDSNPRPQNGIGIYSTFNLLCCLLLYYELDFQMVLSLRNHLRIQHRRSKPWKPYRCPRNSFMGNWSYSSGQPESKWHI